MAMPSGFLFLYREYTAHNLSIYSRGLFRRCGAPGFSQHLSKLR